MSDDESTRAKENSTAPKAAEGEASSAPVDFQIIDLEPIGKALERSRAAAQGPSLRRPPTARVGKVDDKSAQYNLAGDAIDIPSVFSTQNVSRSVRSGQPQATGPLSASQASSNAAAKTASLNRNVLLLSLAVALLAVTNAITAYKLYSRSGQEPLSVLAQTSGPEDWAKPRPGTGDPHPTAAGSPLTSPKPAAGAPPEGEPGPELPPAAVLSVAEVQEWDAARFAKARIVQAQCAISGKLYMFRTPGCTSFVKFPAEALPAAMTQAPGQTPDVFRLAHAKGEEEPLLDCKMQGGAYIEVRLARKPGPGEDLLRYSATVLAVAKHGDEEILYVCGLPNSACPSLLINLSAIPKTLNIVPAAGSGPRNPMVTVPYANPSTLTAKCRKSDAKAWSSIDLSAGVVIPHVGKVTFKAMAGGAKAMLVGTEPDEELNGLAAKCGTLPADVKTASPAQAHMLELLAIAEGYSIRIEDAAGRNLVAFRLSVGVPRKNPGQD
jgi:hypothetical protein